MTAKQLVLDALRCRPTPRVPWVPFTGVHAGSLIGVPADAYLRSADHIVAGLEEARRRYRPDGLPVVFDLQLEAEVLGCQLHWSAEGPPAVCSHPLADGLTLADLPAWSNTAGRVPVVLEATRRMAASCGDDIALYGLVCGPFTLAMHLWGNDIFLAMFDDPEAVLRVVDHAAAVAEAFATDLIAAGCDVIAVVDPMISQIAPDAVATFFRPAADHLFAAIRRQGALSALFVCGNATPNLEVMAGCACDSIAVDENVDLAQLRQIASAQGKSFGGNLKLTVALLMGDAATCRHDALRCFDAGGDTGFVLSPGCDLPYGVPPANLEAVAELVHDPYRREVARAAVVAAGDDYQDISLPDYAASDQVIVDIITLDSATCPPCQYMVEAVATAAARLDGRVRWQEHKVTGRQGLGMMTHLKVGNIPTICIDGSPRFISQIPDQEALVDALRQAVACH